MDDRVYGSSNEWFEANRETIEREILEVYRTYDGNITDIDCYTFQRLLMLAFDAGQHSGASNPYC